MRKGRDTFSKSAASWVVSFLLDGHDADSVTVEQARNQLTQNIEDCLGNLNLLSIGSQ